MTLRLDVSIGPVQGFVAQSRRTRDLWGSSYLLSFLAGHAMLGARNEGGEIVRPRIEDDPLFRWVGGARGGAAPAIGSLPNHFVVEAKRLLARLVDAGRLTQHGERRGAFYLLAPKDMGAPKPDMGAPKLDAGAPKAGSKRSTRRGRPPARPGEHGPRPDESGAGGDRSRSGDRG